MVAMSFRLSEENKEALLCLANAEHKSMTEYLNMIIEKQLELEKSILLVKDATVKALRYLNIPEKIINVIDKPEDAKTLMSDDKYNEFYKIYKKYKLEAK